LCLEPRHQRYGYRRIHALLRRRKGRRINRRTAWRIMREEGLCQERRRHKARRPKRVEKMRPARPNEGWQIDMTSFQLADLTVLYLVLVTDCCTREIVGWTLDRRCRASEWVSALRRGLERRGLVTKESCGGLTVRSDNGSQPCAKKFVAYLASCGVRGQYTGYNAPDDNAYVERVIRTVKEEEIWLNQYETFSEAHAAIEGYVKFYNEERIHSALGYRTPSEIAAAFVALTAA
jgi:putative transposase